jgi:hypothetical protein
VTAETVTGKGTYMYMHMYMYTCMWLPCTTMVGRNKQHVHWLVDEQSAPTLPLSSVPPLHGRWVIHGQPHTSRGS